VIEVHYLEQPTSDYIQCTVNTILDIHRNLGRGDVLAFMTGQDEIESVCALVQEQAQHIQWFVSISINDRQRLLVCLSLSLSVCVCVCVLIAQ
jgi:HrpA-like RNA helicase